MPKRISNPKRLAPGETRRRSVPSKKSPKRESYQWNNSWGTKGIVGRKVKKDEDRLMKLIREAQSGRNGRR